MDNVKLPPNTAALWRRLQNESLLANSYLIGGTALALQIEHRLSEDFDFLFISPKLPLGNIDALIQQLRAEGFEIERNDDPLIYDEFLLGGGSLHDYQQDFILNNDIKMTFFADDSALKVLKSPLRQDRPVIPLVQELFDMKALVVERRDKSRDWLDLYVLMKDHKFAVADFIRAYEKVGRPKDAFMALEKLSTIPSTFTDEGYHALISPAPSISELREFFDQAYRNYKTPN